MAFKIPEAVDPSYVLKIWEDIGSRAPALFTESRVDGKTRAFVAGGDLIPHLLDSHIIKGLRENANDGVVEIAGTPQKLRGITSVARLYNQWDVERRCSDERLVDTADVGHGVHCKCGMCAAVQAASNTTNLENWLLDRVGGSQKQPIREMPHASIVLQASIDTSTGLSDQMRERLAGMGAGEFRFTVPVAIAREMQKPGGIDVLDAAVGLSAGPLSAIIQRHNQYAEVAERRILVLDQAKASAADIDAALKPLINHFDPANLLRIDSSDYHFKPKLENLR